MWDLPAGKVCGREYSLNQIEHDELRKKWDEPAVHACIVCASASCPDLRPEAFVASKLREQMDDQLRVWMANPTKGLAADQTAGVVKMSRIFLWFADDFGGSLPFQSARHTAPSRCGAEPPVPSALCTHTSTKNTKTFRWARKALAAVRTAVRGGSRHQGRT